MKTYYRINIYYTLKKFGENVRFMKPFPPATHEEGEEKLKEIFEQAFKKVSPEAENIIVQTVRLTA